MTDPLLVIPTLALIRNPFVREMLHFLCRPRRMRTAHIFAQVLGAGSSMTNADRNRDNKNREIPILRLYVEAHIRSNLSMSLPGI